MTYTQIIDKIKRVFESCTNKGQLLMAYIYCSRLKARYFTISYPDGEIDLTKDYWLVEKYIDEQDLIGYKRLQNIKNNN